MIHVKNTGRLKELHVPGVALAEALGEAAAEGVRVSAYDSVVLETSIAIG